MPLWYHPPAVPVNLGAPVYPGPLMYHPAPVLVDPRPQYPCDTLYCACQFSIGPAVPPPQWSSSAAAPPAIIPLPEKPRTIKKHFSWAGPSRTETETEWEYEVKRSTGPAAVGIAVERNNTQDGRRLNIRLSGGHLRAHYAPPPTNTTTAAERVSKVVSLDEETVARIRTEIRKDLERIHGKSVQAQTQAPPAQPEIAGQHDHMKKDSDQSKENSEKERIEKIRDEVRKEMAATYEEKMKSLEARELDIKRRMDAIRKREAQWIESYGEGIIKGEPAASVRRQPPPEAEEQNFVSDLDDSSANDEEDDPPATLSEAEPQQTPRPMRWLFRDHELKSYYEPPPSSSGEGHSSTAGDSPSSSRAETFASAQSSTVLLEGTSESVKANIARLTGATQPEVLFGGVSRPFSSRPSSRTEEEGEVNTFRDAPNARSMCYNFEFFDAGPTSQPWKWFETGRNEHVSKTATVMGPTYNISSLISNPDGISLKRSYEQSPENTSPNAGVGGRANPDTTDPQQNLPSSSSCSSSYVSALRDLALDVSVPPPRKPGPAFGTQGSKESQALSRRTNSSQSTVIKTPQASPLEDKRIPVLHNHFTPDKQANAFPLKMNGEYSPNRLVAKAKQPVYDAPQTTPFVKKESRSVSDMSEIANLEDRDFSFCEPFYDWSIHDSRLRQNPFTMPTETEFCDGRLQAAPPLRSEPCPINFEENSDLSSNLFNATKYVMTGARLTKPYIRMTGELKWPPSPTVYTLSTTSASDEEAKPETRHNQNTVAEAEGDLLLSNKPSANPHPHRRPPTTKSAAERSHILDEPIVFSANPYLQQFHSPPITPTKPYSPPPPSSENVRVFKLPPSTTGHELTITISRSVSEASTIHSDDDDGHDAPSPPPSEYEESNPDSLRDHHHHHEDAAAERRRGSKRVKSVHWGAATEAERQFAVSEGMSYYELDSDVYSEGCGGWSEDGEDGGEGDDEDGAFDDDDQEEEEEEEEEEEDADSICGSQASTRGVVDATC